MFELLSSIICLGGIGEDFDEHYWVQQHVAAIGFKPWFTADNRKVWIGVQPTRLLIQLSGTLEASAPSRLDFWVAGVARLQCVEEKPNSGESGYYYQPPFSICTKL